MAGVAWLLTQTLAWAATILGLTSTWLAGRHKTIAWPAGIACCALWVAVNWQLDVPAGIMSALIAAVLAAWNWRKWAHPSTGDTREMLQRNVPEPRDQGCDRLPCPRGERTAGPSAGRGPL